MACIATKPLKEDQIFGIINKLAENYDYNLLAITGLLMKATRIKDVLRTIRIEDVYTNSGEVREELQYKEVKTKKPRIIPLQGKFLRIALEEVYKLIKHRNRNENLFYSQKGKFSGTPISTVTVNRKLKRFINFLGIEEISTHAIRKTACRLMYKKGMSLTTISELLNHSDTKITARYICVNQEDIAEAYKLLEF